MTSFQPFPEAGENPYMPKLGTWAGSVQTAIGDVARRINSLEQGYPPAISPVTIPMSPRFVALGHSIIAAGDGTTKSQSDTIQHMVSAYSGGRLELVKNAGVAGDTSKQILERFDADVASASPGVVLIMARTNDYGGGGHEAVSFEDSKLNHQSLIDECRAIGAVPIMTTTLPKSGAGTLEKEEDRRFDGWLRAYCAQQSILCVDVWAAVVDEVADAWPSDDWTNDGSTGLSDGIHPLPLAQYKIAQAIVGALPDSWPKFSRLAVSGGDPTNAINNSLMLLDSDSDGRADEWVEFNSPSASSRSYSIVDDPFWGKMQRISVDESSGAWAGLRQEPATLSPSFYTAGDVIGVYVGVTVEDMALSSGKNVRARLAVVEGGAPAFAEHEATLTAGVPAGRALGVVKHERAVLGIRFTARDGIFVTSVRVCVDTATLSGSSGGKGYLQFTRPRLVNLTRMGLVG